MAALGQSRLGFGCAAIPGQLTRQEALTLLETALDSGVRHFDVARMYEHGRAEGIVGEFARKHRDEIVIVTKAGIDPPGFARRALRQGPRFGRFGAGEVRASVEKSLRELHTDRVDALLLHECSVQHITDDLLETLENLKTEGKVLQIGIACTPEQTGALITAFPHICGIVQISAVSAKPRLDGSTRILHSVLSERLRRLEHHLAADDHLAQSFARAVGVQPTNQDAIAGLLLQEALTRAEIVLFSSSNAERVRKNAALAERTADVAVLDAFLPFVNLAAASKRAV